MLGKSTRMSSKGLRHRFERFQKEHLYTYTMLLSSVTPLGCRFSNTQQQLPMTPSKGINALWHKHLIAGATHQMKIASQEWNLKSMQSMHLSTPYIHHQACLHFMTIQAQALMANTSRLQDHRMTQSRHDWHASSKAPCQSEFPWAFWDEACAIGELPSFCRLLASSLISSPTQPVLTCPTQLIRQWHSSATQVPSPTG